MIDSTIFQCLLEKTRLFSSRLYNGRMRRSQEDQIRQDLSKKMVFLVGPRQVGKTWLAKKIGESFENVVYLNEDHGDDRKIIREESWVQETELLILDELHKMDGWKNYLKGIYDTKPKHLQILVTGSARLDTFRRAGDALSGRFFVHRLLPFSVAELSINGVKNPLDILMRRGGFPESILSENDGESSRWREQYSDGLIRSDILDFERVHDLRAMQMVVELLRSRVGSIASFASIARDIGISPTTVSRYIQILEALFIVFRVTPFSRSIARSVLKEPKIYFFDTGMVKKEGARYENLVAVSLLKHCYAIEDLEGKSCKLQYLRTKEGREVDFCIVRDQKVEQVIEAKLRDKTLDPGLRYFCGKYDLPGTQLVKDLRMERQVENIGVRRAEEWLAGLRM